MRVRAPFAAGVAWSLLCGAVLGALRTRRAALHLLEKNQALLAAGVPPLPGEGHWAEMASAAPALAGSVFFGLSLGLGTGALLALWVSAARDLGGPRGRVASLVALAPAVWAALAGDLGLAAALAAMGAGTVLLLGRPPLPAGRSSSLAAVCSLIAALGLLPWAQAEEGGFTRFRDRVLFRTQAGVAVAGLYYRWTLYPAEALKAPASRTQPTIAPSAALPPSLSDGFCREAWTVGLVCVGRHARGADATAAPGPGGALVLSGQRASVRWPKDAGGQAEAWRALSAGNDPAAPLRTATGFALRAGCPLALLWFLGSLASRLGATLPNRRAAAVLPMALAGLFALGLAALSVRGPALARAAGLLERPPSRAALEELLRSPDPAARYYAARAAARLGPPAEGPLLAALRDPVINVRYAAAESLGFAGSERARDALFALLRSPEEWYVKERAYAALRRQGWDGSAR